MVRRPPRPSPAARDAEPAEPAARSADPRRAALAMDLHPERRLLRVRRLALDHRGEDPGLDWHAALRSSSPFGDSGRLLLLGVARDLPPPLTGATRRALVGAVRQVNDPAKRALAYLALAEVTPLTANEVRAAGVTVLGIPDATLRIMILTRLAWRVG